MTQTIERLAPETTGGILARLAHTPQLDAAITSIGGQTIRQALGEDCGRGLLARLLADPTLPEFTPPTFAECMDGRKAAFQRLALTAGDRAFRLAIGEEPQETRVEDPLASVLALCGEPLNQPVALDSFYMRLLVEDPALAWGCVTGAWCDKWSGGRKWARQVRDLHAQWPGDQGLYGWRLAISPGERWQRLMLLEAIHAAGVNSTIVIGVVRRLLAADDEQLIMERTQQGLMLASRNGCVTVHRERGIA